MKFKMILPSIALALSGLVGSAHAITVADTFVLPTADFTIFTPNNGGLTYYELIASVDTLASFTLEGANPPATVTYKIYADSDAAIGSATIGGPALITATGVSSVNPDYFFQYLMSAGAYVLEIFNPNSVGGAGKGTFTEVSAVPLPGAIWLFASALLGFFGFSSRRKV